jgi:hypothetical protein
LVAITPLPQWVRVIGGYSELQFAAKRLPTIRTSAVERRRIQWHAEGGRRDQARHDLALVYGRFSEGFETADLRIARQLMKDLEGSGVALSPPSREATFSHLSRLFTFLQNTTCLRRAVSHCLRYTIFR